MKDKIKKQKQIKDLKEGEPINDIFVVKIKRGISQYKKGFRFNLVLSDSSGSSLDYTYWGDNDEESVNNIYKKIKEDSVILIQGKISLWNNKLQLSSSSVEEPNVLAEDEYDADFIMKSEKNIGDMITLLQMRINLIEDERLKQFILNIFTENISKFKNYAGVIQIHHNWKGGLLEHTLEVIEITLKTKELFHSLDSGLLIAGSFLHDLGKLEELEMTSRIKATTKGQLIGHLTLGVLRLNNYLEGSNLDETTKNKLLHIITSHHGKLEFGSPKAPMFPEATAIYFADELSSKLSAEIKYKKEMSESTDDDFAYNYKRGNVYLR